MNTKLECFSYDGYFGSAEVSHEDHCLVGQILYIDDLVMYEGATYAELEQAFQQSVVDYVQFCREAGKEPAKAYSGTFNVRIGPDLHSKAARAALRAGVSLNDYVKSAITQCLANTFMPESKLAESISNYYFASTEAVAVRQNFMPTNFFWSNTAIPEVFHNDVASSSSAKKVRLEIIDGSKGVIGNRPALRAA